MTIPFVPHVGPLFVIGLGGDDEVTIHLGDRAASIDPDSCEELGRLLVRAARIQQLRRERMQLNLARQRPRR